MKAKADYLAALADRLEQRANAGLRRSLALPAGIDVTSNDYLGYAQDPELAEQTAETVRLCGIGAGAARLLRGHLPLHDQAERALAIFSNRQAALLFSSGWAANTGLWSTLTTATDVVLSHAANHASIIDGLRLSRAKRLIFNDFHELDRLLRAPRPARAFVAIESVHSMSGQLTDLLELSRIANQHGALLVVDEAHATGLYGPTGSGRVAELGLQNQVLCTIHTGGKALGVAGAWVAGDAVLVETLVNFCRSFIYSTAVPPAVAGGLLHVLSRLPKDVERVRELHLKSKWLRDALSAEGLDLGGSQGCIIPVILGSPERAMEVAARMRTHGFDVRAVRPPTVPEGTSRLRLVVRAPLAWSQIHQLAALVSNESRG